MIYKFLPSKNRKYYRLKYLKFNLKSVKLIFSILLAFFITEINATKYYAGDISYSWVSGYTYSFKISTYTNLTNDDACEVTIDLGGGTMAIPRSNGSAGSCPSPALSGVPFNATILYNEYAFTHTFPGPGSYNLQTSPGTRIPGIINIPNSVNQLLYLDLNVNISTFLGTNSQPQNFTPLVNYGCLTNGCYLLNMGGSDTDGDSLSFSVLSCSNAGAVLPPNMFSISSTGMLSWCDPLMAGPYNFIVKVDEWRKNSDGLPVRISYTRKDMQINLETCTGMDDTFSLQNNSLAVYPNPTSGIIEITNLSGKNIESLKLLDVSGKIVMEEENKPLLPYSTGYELNLESLPMGIYFLRISDNGHLITKKIIKH